MRTLSCSIKSHVHKLPKDVFDGLDQNDTYINISYIDDLHLNLEFTDQLAPKVSEEEFSTKVHKVFNIYIVALNVCTVGLFLPTEDNYLSPKYQFKNVATGVKRDGVISHEIHNEDIFGRILTKRELIESLLFFGALVKENNAELISEYLRGIVHLSLNYPGAYFEKDAFANFFRVFEHLITTRVLQQKKLSNEFKEYTKALTSFGLSKESISEFKELYKLRGQQAMHAQLSPAVIDRETTMKMKFFCDITIQKVYKPIWEKGIKKDA